MLDAPVDVWYAWLGLAIAGTVTLGVASGLPSAPPPDASGVARTVDTVAVASAPAAARHRLGSGATEVAVRVTTHGVSLRSDGGSASAEFASASVVPVERGDRLAGVALGDPPGRAFATPAAFAEAVATAREAGEPANATWSAGRTLHVRHVSWGETDVTLVVLA